MLASAGNSVPSLRRPVTSPRSFIRRAFFARGGEVADMLPVGFGVPLGEECQGFPQDFVGRVLEGLFGAPVEEDDPLFLVDRDDRVGRDREDGFEKGNRRAGGSLLVSATVQAMRK